MIIAAIIFVAVPLALILVGYLSPTEEHQVRNKKTA
jgi:hypothetical protein